MDLSPGPTDSDEIIQRYGRRLFVLAYHLTGDGAEADELTIDVLMRAVLAPDQPASEREAGVFLSRLLIAMWKDRLQSGDKGGGPRAVAPGSRGHEALWRALSRLDPVSRAVLVLRLAEGLEYETIGKVLDMAPDVVYARLLQARGGLREADRLVDPAVFETMNLYLDARLPAVQRGEFERRIQADSSLREQVEFHRGLTLELHEETPPLPRDFVPRVHGRIERARETLALVDQATLSAGWEPAAAAPRPVQRRWPLVIAGSVAAGVIVVLSVALLFALRRSPAAPGTAPSGPSLAVPPQGPSATPDQATIEALRSLGYLAPGKERQGKQPLVKPVEKGAKPRKPARAAPGPSPATTPARTGATPAPPMETRGEAAAFGPPAPAATTTSGDLQPEGTPPPPAPSETSVPWRILPVAGVPDSGRDYQVIRTEQGWAALFEGAGAPAPAIAFDKEMAILLRYDLAGDPPSRLVVRSVRATPEALVIECRKEETRAVQDQAGAPAAGQVVVLPIADQPIRVVID